MNSESMSDGTLSDGTLSDVRAAGVRHWVVGSGGLLGSAVTRALQRSDHEVFDSGPIRWAGTTAQADLNSGLARLVSAGAPWVVYWCAGAATTAADAAAFARENDVFAGFVDGLAALPAEARARGVVFFASSAGGVYGGGTGAPFTEQSATAPLGLYGEAKLRHEKLLTAMAAATGIRVAIGRIANLYGPGQSLTKQQGLVSRLCISSLTNTPLSIFVPIDTMRDYLYVDEGAELAVAMAARLLEQRTGVVTKIFASGRSTTIGALIAELGMVAARRPPVIWGQSAQSSLQSRDLRLRSEVFVDLDHGSTTNLADGIARTLEDLRMLRSVSRG
jgi:UDP-glucose 4-epimerase